MKKYLFIILFLWSWAGVRAQLYVQSGAILHIDGTITLQNEDFIRSSPSGPAIVFEPGSNILFTGNADNIISGYIDFLNLEIAKDGSHQVSLRDYNDAVRGQMVFTSGFFNLNNNSLFLGNTGILINENDNSRIIGPTGGAVQARLQLNQPAGINPGNIGAAITSTKDLGDVTINRGYVYISPLPPNSIHCYYSFHFTDPSNDANLDATLRLNYFDADLAGANETKLVPWKYDEALTVWQEQGSSENISRNTVDNWVQVAGMNSLSTWTLAESVAALPVKLSLFNVACKDNTALISWQTATEINTDHFEVQRSSNGTDWSTIAVQQARGQSSSLLNYSYVDAKLSASTKIFYRIKSVDIDGSENYSSVNSAACGNGKEDAWRVWPNPAQQEIYIRLTLDGSYKTFIRLIDCKGSIVRQWQKELVRGNNQFVADLQGLSAGLYYLIVTWDEGRGQKSAKILKE